MSEWALWAQEHATTVMLRVRRALLQLAILTSVVLLILWMSVFLYGSFYYSYMPSVSYTTPVHLGFRTDCDSKGVLCSYPSANVSLLRNGKEKVMMYGQPYRISLWLQMPESPINQNLGMFMVQLSCYTKAGAEISTVSKSAMLHYKSGLLQLLDTLLYSPLFITGLVEQAQIVEVEFYSDYKEDSYAPTIGAVVEIHSRHIEIYKAQLQIRAYFTGIRYLLYSFPVMSAIIGVSTNFTFLCVLVLASYLHVMWGSLWQPARPRIQAEDELLGSIPSSQLPIGRSQSLSVHSYRSAGPGSLGSVPMGSQHRTSIPRHTATPRNSMHDEDQQSLGVSALSFFSSANAPHSLMASEHSSRGGMPMNTSAANQGGSRLSQPSLHGLLTNTSAANQSISRISQHSSHDSTADRSRDSVHSARLSQHGSNGLPLETVGVNELPSAADADTDGAQFHTGSRESTPDGTESDQDEPGGNRQSTAEARSSQPPLPFP